MKNISQFLASSILLFASFSSGAASLREAYAPYFKVGVALGSREVAYASCRELAAREFSSATAENVMKPAEVQPREGVFDWSKSDAFVSFAEKSGMKVIGHCLVWHSQTAPWMFEGPDGRPASRELMIERMRDHIHAVVGRYKGRVKGWDVVNEAIEDDGSMRKSKWFQQVGGDFIALAFKFAHEADPDAELYYNDYSMASPGKREAVVRLVRDLKARGLRIDGVGMQSHLSLVYPDLGEYEASLAAFAAEGVKVCITELDVSVLPSAWGQSADISATHEGGEKFNPWKDGNLPAEMQAKLATRYCELFDIYLRHAEDVDRVTFWGLNDAQSWLNNFPVRGRTDYPLLFDRAGRPKPCYDALLALPAKPRAEVDLMPGVRNPLGWADLPDPAMCSDGEWNYLVTTTMHLMPGAPVMRSKDCVNWETVSYVFDRIDDGDRYDLKDGKTVYGQGQWASSIRYHKGKFYVWFVCNGGRGFLYSANKAEGPWKLVSRPQFRHDGSLFFDDDGRAYVFSGQGELSELKADLSDFDPKGRNRRLFDRSKDPEEADALLEGSSVFKKDGWYYLMMISMKWGVPGRIRREVCYRARSLDADNWEKKVILETPFESWGGVGQGGVWQCADGKWRAIIFQDRGGVGRTPCVMPVRFVDDWPMLGEKNALEGKAPNSTGRIPNDPGAKYADVSGFIGSDEFDSPKLSLYWQFNHNPDDSKWSLAERPGWMRLKTANVTDNLFLARNTLTQRMCGPTCSGEIRLDVSHMKEGDRAGIAAFNGLSATLAVEVSEGKRYLVMCEERSVVGPNHVVTGVERVEKGRVELTDDMLRRMNGIVALRVRGDFRKGQDWAEVDWQEPGGGWHRIGSRVKMVFDLERFFMGAKFGVFCYATKSEGGFVDVDSFRFATEGHETRAARFTDFKYSGKGELEPCDLKKQYRNPIVIGMGPDPAITKKGGDFYLAQSSFSYFPGIPVYHSKDLVNWDFCGYVGNRTTNLKFPSGLDLSAGVFAPDIKYNPYNDTFYLIVTVIGDRDNVVYKTKDPYLGWSEPIPVPVGGIDPSFYFEDDKTAWILNNDDAPDGKAEYPGHRTVRMRKYDLLADKCVPGTERIIINKGVRPEEKPIWCEGPHLYKIDGRYWVMTAEGGTGGWHSEVMWVSDNVEGPYQPCKINPILTQRDLPGDRPNPVTAAGHADLFQTPDGGWMAVFLGIEPYEMREEGRGKREEERGKREEGKWGLRQASNAGRSTFLLPVEWVGEGKDRQPVILPKGKVVPRVVDKRPWQIAAETKPALQLSGNVEYTDDFATSTFDYGWFALRSPYSEWAKSGVGGRPGLVLDCRAESLSERGTPSFLARWVRGNSFDTELTVDFEPTAQNEFAGLCCYQNERHHYEIGKTVIGGQTVVAVRKTDCGKTETIATEPVEKGALRVRIIARGKDIAFAYNKGGSWRPLGPVQDASILSTDHAGGFVAATVGPFATCK